jgi:uncharacterized protein YgiM (DUF1202 family)
MKLLSMITATFLFFCISCKNEPSISELEKAKQSLDSKRKELSEKQELMRIESEMKNLSSELQKLNGIAPKKATQGKIVGSDIIMRSDASTQASKMSNFNSNEIVQIFNKQDFMNSNEAIVNQDLQIDNNFRLNKGKSVRLTAYYSTNDTYDIQFERPNGSTEGLNLPAYVIEKTENESWYQVRRNDGNMGWVYGKYLKEI